MLKGISLILGVTGSTAALFKAWSLFSFARVVFTIPNWDAGRFSGQDPLTTALYTAYVLWGVGGLIGLFAALGLLGSLLTLRWPRVARGFMLSAAVLTLILATGVACLLIYAYPAPRNFNFARTLAGPLALLGGMLFVAGLCSRRRKEVPKLVPTQSSLAVNSFAGNYCSNCRQLLKPGAGFCTSCGAPAAGTGSGLGAMQRCPNPQCGRMVAADKTFCTGCGQRLVRQ